MHFKQRIQLLTLLKDYLLSDQEEWKEVKNNAHRANGFFTVENINRATNAIANQYLDEKVINNWMKNYPSLPVESNPKMVGLVMAGNIPLVGFHDFLCVFLSGHLLNIKLSSKDEILWKHIFNKMSAWDVDFDKIVKVSEMLKNCDAYIATGSNNSATFFNAYFGKYHNIIRSNRTSVAILTGDENDEQLQLLSDDIFSFFGLGCRNVTQIFVPNNYNFDKLLSVFKEKENIINHNKYKNNYDYHLAIYLMNKVPYLTNDMVLLVENNIPFAPIGTIHYQYYNENKLNDLVQNLGASDDVQAIVSGEKSIADLDKVVDFGAAQCPEINDYADGVDTMKFLASIN